MPPRDYDELDEYENPNFRWVSLIVLLLAVAGFLSLAWYAYQTGAEHGGGEDVVVIEAEDAPLKEIPENPGGMEFPHQDKTIYSVPTPGEQERNIEVIPAPEEPQMPKAEPPVEKSEPADRKIAQIIQKAVEDTQRDIHRGVEPNERTLPEPEEQAEAEEPVKEIEEAPAAEEKKAEEVKPAEPVAPVPVKAETKLAVAPVPVAAAPVKKEEPKTAPAPATGSSSAMLQLGAFRSEAEALAHWKKLQAKHGALVSGLSSNVLRADLGAKGIYYRLRARGFASAAAANATCVELTKQKQPCFLVK